MKKNMYWLGASILLCTNVIAQDVVQKDSMGLQQLDDVVVTDSRFELKRENSGKTVIKISAEELERNQGRSLVEIINTKSGIEVNGSRSYAGQNISIFARGGNNRQVLVVIDGIQASDPSNVNGEYDLRLLNLSQIESIEILKGAASTLYGNSAATAVINITTKKVSKKGTSLEVLSSLGTNQSASEQNYNLSDFSNTATLVAEHDGFSILASGGHQFTDGLSAALGEESDSFSRIDGNFSLGYQFSERFKVTTSAFYNKLDSDFDNGFPVEDANFSFKSEQSRFTLASTYEYQNGSIQMNGAFNQITRTIDSDFPSYFDSESFVLDVFNKYSFGRKLYTIIGINFIENTTVFSEEETTISTDPYANVVFLSDFGLNINAGVRLNNHSDYGSNFIYNLNPSYTTKLKRGYVKFFGSYATSFIAPNLSQLYGPFGPNPDLEPEINNTLEGGIEYRPSDKLRISALYFNRREEGRIQFVTIDPTTFESQYRNTEETVNFDGFEFELQAKPLENLSLSANYTYTNSENGLALRIPKNKINASIGYDLNDRTYISLAYQYVAERTDTDFSTFTSVDLNPFSLMDLYIKHDISPAVRFFLSINNILNEEYVEIIDFTSKGRNMRLGMRLKL
ncbi:TonB-dependent receptor plug domain-containing protein [Maribacter aestuarii]|uniref:TonB-dependent receptor plug domain-containing protein n=1 Tax=Maribacter aestuarii TaxID=1130723 RepID=UPI0025A62260|nr:TonB-dependent receptor [Maribacter aestuarii]